MLEVSHCHLKRLEISFPIPIGHVFIRKLTSVQQHLLAVVERSFLAAVYAVKQSKQDATATSGTRELSWKGCGRTRVPQCSV